LQQQMQELQSSGIGGALGSPAQARPDRGGNLMTADKIPRRVRVLVVTLRRLGDVLLTTPLIRTLKAGLPDSSVAALVFSGTDGVLAGNPDLDEIIVLPQRSSAVQAAKLLRRLWRRFDLAVTTQTGDRPVLLAWVAGRRRIGFLHDREPGGWWKRWALDDVVRADPANHRVTELLRLADCIGLQRRHEIVCPRRSPADSPLGSARYAVLHASPLYRIRRWTDEGWRALAAELATRGMTVVATGAAGAAEKDYLDRVWQRAAVVRLDGKLDWPALSGLLRGAAVYVGPDTSVTHLAAAAGCPTVALYGPASPLQMGPWPVGGHPETWVRAGTIQHHGNVWVVQNPLPCMPCDQLGCDRHVDSYSRCLDELPLSRVLAAVDQALAARAEEKQGVASGLKHR
jgi:heptosyltransferase-3